MRDLSILFEPVTVNGLTFPNRIVMAPMGRNFAQDGVPPVGLADYFVKRTVGGVGLCIGEASRVDHPVASNDTLHTAFHGEAALAIWQSVVDAVHSAGGCFMPQIWRANISNCRRTLRVRRQNWLEFIGLAESMSRLHTQSRSS